MQSDQILEDDLYRDVILDHYRSPRHRGRLEHPDEHATGHNPLCGDRLELDVKFERDRIQDLRIQATGCSISQASASMMSEAVIGRSLAEARRYFEMFRKMVVEGAPGKDLPPEMGDLAALEGVKNFPVRVKCAMLAWHALEEVLGRREKKFGPAPLGKEVVSENLREALRMVVDPEIGLSVIDLGLIYGIDLDENRCRIRMTLTTPGCPYGPQMISSVQHVARQATGLKDVEVEVVWDPPWDPRTMASEDGKFMLGLM